MTLQGKTALVTGAARGIGLAISTRLVREGARVALVDLDRAGVEAAAKPFGGQALALAADVTKTDDVERAVRTVTERWGRLDIAVNNAGITGGSKLTWEITDEEWHRVLAVDLTAVFLVSRAAVRVMLGQGSGRIVNIASIAGKDGNPTLVPYSTAKAGVIGLTKALAKEVATRGILVNAIAPAMIETDMVRQMSKETVDMLRAKIPMGRIGRPEEVAALVAWLASDECSFSTGAVYDLSGGRATYWPRRLGEARPARSGRGSPELDEAGRLVGHGAAEQRLDDVEGHVDARRHSGRGDDAVVHHPQVALDLDPVTQRLEEIEGAPMRGRTAAVEQTGAREEQRARAHRRDLPGPGGHAADPGQRGLIVEQGAGPEASGHDEEVDARRLGEAEVRQDAEPARGHDGSRRLGHGEDVERRAVLGAPRVRARLEPCPREELERPGEIEHLDVVKDQDPDVPLVHDDLLARY